MPFTHICAITCQAQAPGFASDQIEVYFASGQRCSKLGTADFLGHRNSRDGGDKNDTTPGLVNPHCRHCEWTGWIPCPNLSLEVSNYIRKDWKQFGDI